MKDLTYPFFLVCVMAAGVIAGWMAAFVLSAVCFAWVIWQESEC